MRSVLFWLGWTVALAALWVLAIGVFTRVEVVAAALAGAASATLMLLLRREGAFGFMPQLSWLARYPKAFWHVLKELVPLAVALVRRPRSAWLELEFPAGGDDVASASRRALATFGENLSPNTIVADIDVDRGIAIRHDLDPTRSPKEIL